MNKKLLILAVLTLFLVSCSQGEQSDTDDISIEKYQHRYNLIDTLTEYGYRCGSLDCTYTEGERFDDVHHDYSLMKRYTVNFYDQTLTIKRNVNLLNPDDPNRQSEIDDTFIVINSQPVSDILIQYSLDDAAYEYDYVYYNKKNDEWITVVDGSMSSDGEFGSGTHEIHSDYEEIERLSYKQVKNRLEAYLDELISDWNYFLELADVEQVALLAELDELQ